mmetsp:Transcript_22341/g.45133  ORF Transcript_22341/g.45133 Transcript_22341/m.45133 type:complete len:199 (+) Transcript_22341:33-629(+)
MHMLKPVVLLGLLALAHGFLPSALPSLSRTHPGLKACSSLRMKTVREDGSTEEQVAEAWTVYEKLMETKNDGKGYWMDSPFQFFDNIKQAVDRNFGGNPVTELFDDKPSSAVDLSASPFKPLVSAGDVEMSDDEEETSEELSLPSEGELPVKASGKKGKKGKKKKKSAVASVDDSNLSSMEAAKKKAAALKAELEADD